MQNISLNWHSKDMMQTIDILLYRAELHAHNELALWWNVLKNVGLETPQQVTTQQLVKSLDLLFLRDVRELLQEQLQVAARMHTIGQSINQY